MKLMCRPRNIFVLRLPQYSYDFAPIELAFALTLSKLKRDYGTVDIDRDTLQADFHNSLLECCTAEQAVNMFRHCFLHVSEEEEERWATR